MSEEWGTRELAGSPAPTPMTPPTPPSMPPTPPRPRGGRLTSPALLALGVALAAGLVALGWWVLAGTFRDDSPKRGTGAAVPLGSPLAPGPAPVRAAGLLACVTESNAVTTAKRAAAVAQQAGLEDSARGYLATPDGEYFSVADDGTVTTVKPLPTGCPTP